MNIVNLHLNISLPIKTGGEATMITVERVDLLPVWSVVMMTENNRSIIFTIMPNKVLMATNGGKTKLQNIHSVYMVKNPIWTLISLPVAFNWEFPVELKIGLSEYVIDKDGTPHCLKCDSSNLIYCEEEDVVYNSEFSNGEIIVQGVNSQFTVQKMLYCQSCKIDYKIPDSITVNWDNY
jgi:uncharacterized protein YbaR (Trm112 family)